MARFSHLLPVLLLFTLYRPIVCPYVPLSYDRRDRALQIDSSEYSTQQLGQSSSIIRSRLRKPSTYTANNANYRHQEQQVEAPQVVDPAVHNLTNRATHHNNREEITTLTVLEENLRNVFNVNQSHHNHGDETTTHTTIEKDMRSIFDTYIGPGTNEFDNVSRLDSDKMIGDQPDPFSSPPTYEKLGVIYNDDNIAKKLTDSTSLSGTSDSNDNVSGPAYIVDSKDCIEGDAKSDKPLCTRLRNYPKRSHLEEIIKTKFNNLESFFGEDSLMPPDINSRIDNDPPVILCDSISRVIYPEGGLNKDYEWLLIINTKKYRQGVLVEECINEGSVSASIYTPNNYKATCKQNYIYRSLVAYANGTIVKDKFKIPSCCKCVLTAS